MLINDFYTCGDIVLNEGEFKSITIDMKLPKRHYDSIAVWFWNADSDKPIEIRDLNVWAFNE